MRTSSPARSIADRNCEMLSRLMLLRDCALTDVNRRHTEGQAGPSHAGEAGGLHLSGELLLHGKVGDRARQIGVGGAMAAHQSAHQWQHPPEIKQVKSPQYPGSRRRELKDYQPPT